ncbi:MAG TPA: hypothetical protein VLA12_05910, partial [Planctomycetaceae bacterium]|nr:hypothetical protein [Planctomycetaceae bacterium]
SSQRISSMWKWLYGPVLAVSFATRAIQITPETAYVFLTPVRALLIVLLLILGLVSCVSPATPPSRSRLILPLGILLGVGLCTPNPISLAGMYLVLGFLPIMHSDDSRRDRSSGMSQEDRTAALSVIPVVLGSLMILVGLFQGSGSGDRGLLELLVTGSGLALFVSSSVRSERPRTSLTIELRYRPQTHSEFPLWEPGLVKSQQSEQTAKPAIRRLLTRAVLIVGMLILPQQAWQRIRWDVQKVEFPVVSSEAPLSTNNADSRGIREGTR